MATSVRAAPRRGAARRTTERDERDLSVADLARRAQPRPDDAPVSIARVILTFVLIGLVVLAVVSVLSALVSRNVATKAAINDAKRATLVYAKGLVRPLLTDGLLDRDPDAIDRIDRVKSDMLSPTLIRVKIWSQDGTILYSDEAKLIGQRFVLAADEVEAFTPNNKVVAEVSSASSAENEYEHQYGKLLEVYLPLTTPNGTPILFESYYVYDGVKAAGRRLWLDFSPVTLGSLLLLEIAQIPLAISLARRLKRGQRQRERLLQHAIDSSEQERRRVASDLHDGVVQDLTGVSLQLAAASMRRDANGANGANGGHGALGGARGADADLEAVTTDAAHRVRESIRSLRALLVDIYPPNLYDEGLDVVLSDMATRLSNRGIRIKVDVALPESLPREVTGLLYRGAQEAMRNVLSHAEASEVSVTARADDEMAMLVVRDNGRGFVPDSIGQRPREGHVGLRVLADLAAEAGGLLRVESSPGLGTRVRLGVPIR